MNIFPKLKGSWATTNLDEDSRKTGLDFSVPEVCQNWINKLCAEKKVSYIYGGYLEDRTHLWKNKESESASSLIHLGIDYSVPAGTEVTIPLNGEVFHIMKDPTNTIGWGGRIIFKLDNGKYLIYGHLKQDIALKIGQKLKKGEIVGIIGETSENGYWWPHLHAQLIDEAFIQEFSENLDDIDGYLPKGDKNLSHTFNPEEIINNNL